MLLQSVFAIVGGVRVKVHTSAIEIKVQINQWDKKHHRLECWNTNRWQEVNGSGEQVNGRQGGGGKSLWILTIVLFGTICTIYLLYYAITSKNWILYWYEIVYQMLCFTHSKCSYWYYSCKVKCSIATVYRSLTKLAFLYLLLLICIS